MISHRTAWYCCSQKGVDEYIILWTLCSSSQLHRVVCRDCFSNILLNSNLLSFSPVWMNYQFFSSAFLLIFPETISGMRDTVPEVSVHHRLSLVKIVIFVKSKVCQRATSKVADSLWDAFVLWFCCICLQGCLEQIPCAQWGWTSGFVWLGCLFGTSSLSEISTIWPRDRVPWESEGWRVKE